MLKIKEKQLSFYSVLYEKIPENHLLKRIEQAVDFSFINELLADSYCKDFGRPAKEPEMMMKLNMLEYLYGLSDERVIEESTYNLAFLWFLGLNPEDKLPNPSLLAKFRTQRMKNTTLDEVMSEIVRQCVEKGIIKGTDLSIDSTHISANCKKQVPERIMKHLAKRIFKGLEKDCGSVPDSIDTQIPEYKEIEDPQEAKVTMQAYLEGLMNQAEAYAGDNTSTVLEESREILADEKFILQKGLRSLADKDARVGSKSQTDRFFGYKTEYTMTAAERIITAMDVHSGEYVDGKEFDSLLRRTTDAGVRVLGMLGDKAYFRPDILKKLEEQKIKGYIPVSASVYKVDEQLYSYNKDSDQWFCFMGNYTVSRKKRSRVKNGKEYKLLVYLFSREQCANCPHRATCIGKTKSTAKKLEVSESVPIFYEKSKEQQTEEFKEHYKRRASHEWKNAEMKCLHGLARARGWGLRSIAFQAKLTGIAVNLKRIAALAGTLSPLFWGQFETFPLAVA